MLQQRLCIIHRSFRFEKYFFYHYEEVESNNESCRCAIGWCDDVFL